MALLWLQVHLMMARVGVWTFLMVIVFRRKLSPALQLAHSLHQRTHLAPDSLSAAPSHPRRAARVSAVCGSSPLVAVVAFYATAPRLPSATAQRLLPSSSPFPPQPLSLLTALSSFCSFVSPLLARHRSTIEVLPPPPALQGTFCPAAHQHLWPFCRRFCLLFRLLLVTFVRAGHSE
jgi:hypothetical protein